MRYALLAALLALTACGPLEVDYTSDYGPKFRKFCPKSGFTPQQCWFLACMGGHGKDIGYDCDNVGKRLPQD